MSRDIDVLGWLNGEPPQRCARYGAVAGAYACTVPSTDIDAIGRDELLAHMAELESDTA